MRYIDDVKYALVEIGGEARLEDVYGLVLKNRSERGDKVGHCKEYVWSTLQKNSEGRGHNIFDLHQVEEGKVICKLI
jgi:hypothetical protein